MEPDAIPSLDAALTSLWRRQLQRRKEKEHYGKPNSILARGTMGMLLY